MGVPPQPGEPAAVPLAAADGALLAGIAAETVRTRLLDERVPGDAPGPAALRTLRASFVTLERQGRLRGCIGSLHAARPLYLDVIRNAGRAMADPRLPPVSRDDWPELDVTVSALTTPAPLPVAGFEGLLAALRPGVDGLLLTDGRRRATFLPTVWRRLPDPAEFVTALLAKGGWPRDGWPSGLTAHRYAADEFCDPAPRDPLTGRPGP